MDLKRDQKRKPKPRGAYLFILTFLKKLFFIAVFACLLGLALWAAYTYVEPVKTALDSFLGRINPLIERYGWLPVAGGVLLLLGAIWALIDEQSQKEKRRQRQQQLDSEWR